MIQSCLATYVAFLAICYVCKGVRVSDTASCMGLVGSARKSYKASKRATSAEEALYHLGSAEAYIRSARMLYSDGSISDICSVSASETASRIQAAVELRRQSGSGRGTQKAERAGA